MHLHLEKRAGRLFGAVGLTATILLAGAGCLPDAGTSAVSHPEPLSPHAGHHAPVEEDAAVAADGRVAVLSDLSGVDAAQELRFRLFDADGAELKPRDLKVVHEKLLHLIVVRDDYQEFHHVHPEYLDGQWRVKIAIGVEGVYQAYVDIAPVESAPAVLRQELRIGSGTARAPRLVAKDVVASGAYEASVSPLMGPDGVEFAFAIRKDGVQVADVGPYLGAYGHVVMLREKAPDAYVHLHPITTAPPDDGIVRFGAPLPGPGTYPMYAQFSVDGSVLTFPFVLRFGS